MRVPPFTLSPVVPAHITSCRRRIRVDKHHDGYECFTASIFLALACLPRCTVDEKIKPKNGVECLFVEGVICHPRTPIQASGRSSSYLRTNYCVVSVGPAWNLIIVLLMCLFSCLLMIRCVMCDPLLQVTHVPKRKMCVEHSEPTLKGTSDLLIREFILLFPLFLWLQSALILNPNKEPRLLYSPLNPSVQSRSTNQTTMKTVSILWSNVYLFEDSSMYHDFILAS